MLRRQVLLVLRARRGNGHCRLLPLLRSRQPAARRSPLLPLLPRPLLLRNGLPVAGSTLEEMASASVRLAVLLSPPLPPPPPPSIISTISCARLPFPETAGSHSPRLPAAVSTHTLPAPAAPLAWQPA
jgi:hypothetical protein